MQKINLRDIIKKFNLEIIIHGNLMPDINVSDLNRPGLELAGYFDYYAYDRIQILGETEVSFLKCLTKSVRTERIKKLLSYDIPCIIVARNLNPPEELKTIAQERNIFVLRSQEATTRLLSKLTDFLESELAPRTTIHGVLVDIYGIGTLMIGESGIGKSETAIELIKRGHRLIADDAVIIKQVAKNILVGTAPEIIKHYLEVRGLGIIDVKTIFGAGSIRNDIKINMVIELVEWEKYKESDRLGLEEEKIKILDSYIAKRTIPLRPGRNLAAIMEIAAMDYRLKTLGYNAAMKFSDRLYAEISKNNKD